MKKLSTTKLCNFLRSITFILASSSSSGKVVVYVVHKFVNNVDYQFIGQRNDRKRKIKYTIIRT
jgi:hypothetical protein